MTTKTSYAAVLRNQARTMARHAWALLRIADSMAAEAKDKAVDDGDTATAPVAYEHEQLLAAMAERVVCESARRRQLFPNRIFEERGWELLLVMFRNRVQGRRLAPANLAVELDSTVRDTENLVDVLVEEGLAEWCDRFHFIRLSEDGATRVRNFFIEEETTATLVDDAVLDSSGA